MLEPEPGLGLLVFSSMFNYKRNASKKLSKTIPGTKGPFASLNTERILQIANLAIGHHTHNKVVILYICTGAGQAVLQDFSGVDDFESTSS